MGTTSEKLTYLNVTKQKLKQAINNIGGEVTDETTFREYVNQLENAYDNLPKTDYEEGSNITLSNTLKGKLDFDNGVVGIGQAEQDIDLTENNLTSKTISGLTVTVNEDKSITINGTATALVQLNLLNNTTDGTEANARTLTAGTYYLSGCPGGSDDGTKFKLDVIRPGLAIAVDTGTGSNTTLSSNQIYTAIRIVIYSGTQCNNLIFRPKLLKIPSPSYPQTINSVTGNQDVVVSGINILDKTQVVGNNTATTVTQINTGFRVSAETSGYAGVTTIDVKANTNYFLKFNTNVIVDSGVQKYVRIFAGTTQATTIATYTFTEGGGTFNTGNNTKINIWFYCSLGGSGTVDYTNVQLQEGSSATTYEPYITPTSYQLSLGDIELCGIGNYKDELIYDVDEDKVYKKGKVKQITLNGTENWELQSINSHGIANFRIVIQDYLVASGDSNGLSNYFEKQTSGIADTTTSGFLINNQKYLYIRIDSGIASTKQQFETWLSNHTPIVCYVIDATQTEITDTTLVNQVKALYNAHSNNGTTIITSNGNLPMIIKCRGLKGE